MPKQIIITIHGIRTNSTKSWQIEFEQWFKKNYFSEYKNFIFLHYNYGYLIGPFAWWMAFTRKFAIPSFLRRWIIGGFQKYLLKVRKKYPYHKINILSHSFGTWVSYYAINREPGLKINNLILIQGVISSHIEKLDIDNWLRRKRLKKVFAWSSHEDNVVRVIALPPFGKLGYRGFIRYEHDEDKIAPAFQPYLGLELYNYQHKVNHSDMWDDLDKYGHVMVNQLMENK